VNDGSISTDLRQFLGAYFHQDWDLESDNWEGVVDNYVNDDPVAEPLRTLAREIDNLRTTRTETDLSQFLLRTVGVYYAPEPLAYGEWLCQIANRLRQHAAAIESGISPQH